MNPTIILIALSFLLTPVMASAQTGGQSVAGNNRTPFYYDGDGKADVAVFRPSNGTWYIVGSTTGIIQNAFGQNGDLPTQGAFIY